LFFLGNIILLKMLFLFIYLPSYDGVYLAESRGLINCVHK